MKILNYYRGATDKLSGFLFDTEKKTYKIFEIPGKEWTYEEKRGDSYYIGPREGFRNPGDLQYYFKTFWEMDEKKCELEGMGFTFDDEMVIDFGIFKI